MANIALFHTTQSDTATLSWGSQVTGLGRANLQLPELSKKWRTTGVALANTRLRVALNAPRSFRVIMLGPGNFTTGFKYRIRVYSDDTFETVIYDSDWLTPLGAAEELPFGHPNWWTRVVPYDDPERGIWLIHDFGAQQAGQYWSIEIDDQTNPDGFVEASRLFMPDVISPTINYALDSNAFGFRDNTIRRRLLSGGTQRVPRFNPRFLKVVFDFATEDEAFRGWYRFARAVGTHGEVFVIPDLDDTVNMQRRAFLGTLETIDPVVQIVPGYAGLGFEIEEIT